jgi:hypothetical protein
LTQQVRVQPCPVSRRTQGCRSTWPRGIRQAVELLAKRRGSLHTAHQEVMDSLGEMVWAAQRSGKPFDGARYTASVRRRATRV